jgi:hypothetical protein
MLGFNIQRSSVTLKEIIISIKMPVDYYNRIDLESQEELEKVLDKISAALDKVDFRSTIKEQFAAVGLEDSLHLTMDIRR